MEKVDSIKPLTTRYTWKYNELPTIPVYENKTLIIDNEWDAMEICKMIKEKKHLLIRGRFPGVGKSHICSCFEKMGYNVLSVVPQNMLTQEIANEAITQNMFFSIPVDSSQENLPIYDDSNFDVIVFDEIYMSSPYVLTKIWRYV